MSQELVDFLQTWVDARNTTLTWLFKEAGLASGTSTGVKQGADPKPRTLHSLSRAMGIEAEYLFAAAGYLSGVKRGARVLTIQEVNLLQAFDELSEDRKPLAIEVLRALQVKGSETTQSRRVAERPGSYGQGSESG